MDRSDTVRIGIAGWSIPSAYAELFPEEGTHLERYARVFNCVEINSSFYRHHQMKTYARWAASVPEDFLFAVKLAKVFTHTHRLNLTSSIRRELAETLTGIGALGNKWGALLVQLPPSLDCDPTVADAFFTELKKSVPVPIVHEPRHPTWAKPGAIALVERHQFTPAWADPSPIAGPYSANEPLTGTGPIVYSRLHGSPVIYRSTYSDRRLRGFADAFQSARRPEQPLWCIFDNTTFGSAITDAIAMRNILNESTVSGLRREVHGTNHAFKDVHHVDRTLTR